MAKVHQEISFPAPPARVFKALMDSAEHAKFTNEPATIGKSAGDAWSAYGGKISGRNIEIVENARIVQTWRAGNWAEGVHSLVRIELAPEGEGTKLTIDHDALTDEQVPHLDGGWHKMYWAPLASYFKG